MGEATTWWWLRHGPTHSGAFAGWRDVPADLSDTDLIARVAEYLPSKGIVVSSDLSRAITTADAVGRDRQRLPHQAGLREFNFGDWEGQPYQKVADDFPELSRAFWENPGDTAPPGGESWNSVSARVNECVNQITTQFAGADIIAVAHVGVIMTQIGRAVGATPKGAMANHIDNFSVTEMLFDGAWACRGINHVP